MAIARTLSRYTGLNHVLDLPRLNIVQLPKDVRVRSYVTTDNDRLTKLAAKIYGDAQYYWIIAEYNDIIEPEKVFGRLTAGGILLIPDKAILDSLREKKYAR